MSTPYHILLQVETVDPESLRKGIFNSAFISEVLAEYSVAAAIKLFQGQEVRLILALENGRTDFTCTILTSLSYFYCQIVGGNASILNDRIRCGIVISRRWP